MVKFSYARGDTGARLKELLIKQNKSVNISEYLIGNIPYLKFTIPSRGNLSGEVEINEPKALRLAFSSDMPGVLRLNRLNIPDDTDKLYREYRLLILNLKVIKVWKRETVASLEDKSHWTVIKADDEDKAMKTVTKASLSAVQCLGLDFAMAYVALSKPRKALIRKIDPSPALTAKTLKPLVTFLINSPYSSKIKDLTLGADPEFILINEETGKMIPASQFLPRFGTVGCDSVRIPNRQTRPIGEVRPEPSTSPIILADNIRKTMLQALKLLPYSNLKWIAGSQPENYPIGGHIHFSNIEVSSKLIRALDNYLAIPVMLMENSDTSVLRRVKYGHLSDFRTKDYGGFEYRTVGSWLVTPEITKGVLCLAKIIAKNYVILNRNYFLNRQSQSAFYRGDKYYFREVFDQIWDSISALPDYEEYTEYLEPIKHLCASMTGWDETADIRQTWGLPIPKKKYRAENRSKKKSSSTRASVRVR